MLSDLADAWLWMREWRTVDRRTPERLVVVPFSFRVEGLGVTSLRLPDGDPLVVVEPLRLLERWPGATDAAFEARAIAACAALRAGTVALEPGDDAGYAQLHVGLHRWLHEIAEAAWRARVCWSISW